MAKATKTTKKTPVLTDKSYDELKAELTTIQTELAEAKRSHAARELSNTGRLRELRVSIARIQTVLNVKAREEEKV